MCVVESEEYYHPPVATTSSTAPSVQVVYSASHVGELPDSIVSTISATTPEELYTTPSSASQYPSGATANHHALKGVPTTTDSAQYLATPTPVSSITGEGVSGTTEDLASQYINYNKTSTEQDFVASLTNKTATATTDNEDDTNMDTGDAG